MRTPTVKGIVAIDMVMSVMARAKINTLVGVWRRGFRAIATHTNMFPRKAQRATTAVRPDSATITGVVLNSSSRAKRALWNFISSSSFDMVRGLWKNKTTVLNKACASRVRRGLVLYQNPLILDSCTVASRDTRRNRETKVLKSFFFQLITTASKPGPKQYFFESSYVSCDVSSWKYFGRFHVWRFKKKCNENSAQQTITTVSRLSCRKYISVSCKTN